MDHGNTVNIKLQIEKGRIMSSLLFDKRLLIINPSLACLIGLNESILLQQIHYWIEKKKENQTDFHDGHYWVYNTYKAWQRQFPFWSISTIKRIISSLEKKGILLSGNFNKMTIDRTKWYSINYELLDKLRLAQNETMDVSDRDNTIAQSDPSNTIDYSKITSLDYVKVHGAFVETTAPSSNPNQNKLNWEILKKEIIHSCHTNCINDYTYISEILNIIKYYYNMYYQTFGKEHPFIKQSTMDTIINNLISGTDLIDGFDFEMYVTMINKHFETQYIDYDYNICHFMTEGIRNNRFYETIY